MGQNLIFYTVSGTVVGAAMQGTGFGIGAVMFGSLIAPPIMLIGWKIARIKGWV